ncbi:hypothetical protein PV08_11758 [Exophiala spinifera]|uniref:Transcription factor domain-containing protein n=1 Tax=Exophiala spinifera TaxID=91928 RepID=A0A0D1ZAG6_9EURO|nr:uncharacterized protein PV08_11758 [Exophiala spinifera]KIW09982.1 hypothetical protein PV08_11758 [Exophiala spinifera]
MAEGRPSSQGRRDIVTDRGRGSTSAEPDDESESGASSAPKYRRVNRHGTRAVTASDQSSRFLFVDSSSAGQRPRSDQRAINAHIQQSAYRNRRQAARQQRGSDAANVGRHRGSTQLQPRRIEPSPSVEHHRASPLTSPTRQEPSDSRLPTPTSTISPTPSPGLATNARAVADVDQDLISRLRYYSNVRGSEVRQAVEAQREDDRRASSEHRQPAPLQEDRALAENVSVRSMLTQILQRLDAASVGQPLHGPPISALRNSVLDPFSTSSIMVTPSMDAVLRHFSDVMIPSVFPTRQQAEIQTRWAFEKASQEPLVLYSLLAISSAERDARLGQLRSGSQETTFTEEDLKNRPVPDFVSYKVNAVKLANETMKSIETAAKASTIFAMMCLLSIEVITGNQKEIFAHVSGLQKLIAWRGGYHGIPPHATELILSTSYMCAAMTRTLPASPPTSTLASLPPNLIEDINRNLADDTRQMGTGILTPEVDTILDWRISQAFRDMTEVVRYREYYHEKQMQPGEEEVDYINAKSYQFRYAVLSAPFEPRAPTSDKEEACRLALLIFWFTNYQMSQPDSALNRTLTTQLKSALQVSDLKGLWGPYHELLAWVLLLGAFISAGQRERPWFVLNLAKVCKVLRLQGWTDVRSVLVKYFYLDRIYAKGMQASWEEAAMIAETME